MDDDDIFRLILISFLALFLPVGLFHRLRAATSEKLDRRQEGIVLLVAIRLLGAVLLSGLLVFLINPAWMAWAALPLPLAARWAGVAVCVLAFSWLSWTYLNLGKNITDTVVTRKEHVLVITGPYRWVRHPFYVGLALAVAGLSLMMANWFVFIGGSAVFLLLVFRTRKEEKNLIERFGDEYRRYMARTGGFWPRFSG
jgi:protein-S-isoprenylcysteine O-methyltransferase Ste14